MNYLKAIKQVPILLLLFFGLAQANESASAALKTIAFHGIRATDQILLDFAP